MSAVALPPPNVQPGGSGGLLLRQEVWGPTETLTGAVRYVYRIPVAATWDEIVFDTSVPGSLQLGVQVTINGVSLFTGFKSMVSGALHVPKDQWAAAFQSGALAVDARVQLSLNVQVLGEYDTAWQGLGVTLLKF
jgi:hypothetical protein